MDSFQQQALNFNIPNADFDPNLVPIDGEQYLQKVFYERTKCPAIVVKPLKYVRPMAQTSRPVPNTIWTQLENEDVGDRAHQNLLPTKEWSRYQIRTFKSLRKRVSLLRKRHNVNNDEWMRIASAFPVDDYDSNAWQTYCENNEPLMSIMFTIQQRSLEKLIEHQSNWLVDDMEHYTTNSEWLSQWIYSSLACLHLPLEPNVHNSLRQIAKTCIRLRNQFGDDGNGDTNTDDTDVRPLNLIICIVAHNFNQLDLCGRTR